MVFARKMLDPSFWIAAIANTTTITLTDRDNYLVPNMVIWVVAVGTEDAGVVEAASSVKEELEFKS